MPQEILILIFLSISGIFGLIFTSMILSHRQSRRKDDTSTDGASITTSELEILMRRVVKDATADLTDKIDEIELKLAKTSTSGRQLEGKNTASRLEFEDEVLDVEPIRVSPKTRA